MQSGWTKIFSSPLFFKVELARQVLQENGIEAVIVNKQDSSMLVYGEAELHVPETQVEAAEKILTGVGDLEEDIE